MKALRKSVIAIFELINFLFELSDITIHYYLVIGKQIKSMKVLILGNKFKKKKMEKICIII